MEVIMNKSQSIKLKCRECEEGPKRVTLCKDVGCPLWAYRFGFSMKNKQFKTRMEKAKRNYPKEYQELLDEVSEHIRKGEIPFKKDLIDTFFSKNNQDEG